MAVQLGVFPQNEIDLSYLNNMNYNYWVDGDIFQYLSPFNVNNLPTPSTSFVQDQINHFSSLTGGIQINTSYLGGSSTGGAQPSVVSGNLVFPQEQTCFIQRVNNIIVGANYIFKIEVNFYAAVSANPMKLHEFNGTTLVNTTILTPFAVTSVNTPYQYIVTFSSPTPTLVIEYDGISAASFVVLNSIELLNSTNQPPIINDLSISGEVLLDLYEDEDIPLTLSIDDFTKVAEKVQSYSKSFNIPETKRNKRTFNNIFDITRSDDGIIFNPYKRTECILRVDGIVVFQGYLRLIDVSDKNGEVSYSINLYSETIALKDYLGDLTIGDLDFTELEHDYNATNIKNSAHDSGSSITYLNPSTSGFRETYATLRYPFCDWKHQYDYDADGMPLLERLEDAYRPWIQCKYILNRIFANTPFTFKSTFFDSDDFEKLYMDFNWGDDGIPNSFSSLINQRIEFNSLGTGSSPGLKSIPTASFGTVEFLDGGATVTGGGITYTQPSIAQLNYSNDIFTSDSDNMEVIIDYSIAFRNTSPTTGVTIFTQVNATIGGVSQIINPQSQFVDVVPSGIGPGNDIYFTPNVITQINLNNLDNFTLEIKCDTSGIDQVFTGYSSPTLPQQTSGNCLFNISVTSVASADILITKRGEMKQWEFLSGLLTMFNMLTIPSENYPQEIEFETWRDVFKKPNPTNAGSGNVDLKARGIVNDWTYKIDAQEIKLTPLTEINKNTVFKFVDDPDDHFANVYFKAIRREYGSKEFDASGATILDGEEVIEAEPFAATVIKPLENYLSELIVPSICAFSDGNFKGFDNEARILFNCGEKVMSNEHYGYPSQNGVAGDSDYQKFLQFSHTTEVPCNSASYDFVFESANLFSGVGSPTLNNLFNLYWLPYLSELYNSNTRILTLKINLSASDINTFSFFDLVYIKQRVFRVNRIDYKPKDLSTVELIMIP